MPGDAEPNRSRTLTFPGPEVQTPALPFALPVRWQATRLLGTGGQAEVWLARDLELGEWVAVKVFRDGLTETQRERLRREVRLGRSLSHPNLVKVFELIEAGGRLAVAMEWVSGGSLETLLESGPLPIGQVIAVADEVLDVLAYLHGRGVVHRDVKPSNLLLDDHGRVRLADLGLVRPLEDGGDLTATAMAVGTPGYMSPEQIRGLDPTPGADLYSLGVTLFHLLTGQMPFAGNSSFEVADQHLHASPPDVRSLRPDCPAWLARFVMRLIEKSPRDRWPDAARALDAVRRKRVLASPRFWRRAALATVAAMALGGALLAWVRTHRGAPAAVRVTQDQLVVTDSSRRELWRRRFPNSALDAVTGDFLGEGTAQVAVSTAPAGRGQPAGTEDIAVFGAGGRERARFASVGRTDLKSHFPGVGPMVDMPLLFALDLGDAHPVLAWVTHSSPWFPSAVGIWDAPRGARPGPVLFNSGHITNLCAADLGGRRREMIATGINNRLGYQTVAVILGPGPRDGLAPPSPGFSPDLVSDWEFARATSVSPVVAYVPLGASRGDARVVAAGRSGITVRAGEAVVELDASGNPRTSPLFGRGPGPRRRFWDALATACLEIEAGREEPTRVVVALDQGHRDVLAEPPMRLARTLTLTRSLALAGRHGDAVALLEADLKRTPDESDLWLRLGEQLAIGGRTDEAVDALSEAIRPRPAGRRGLDAAFDMLLLATREGDDALYRRMVGRVSGAGVVLAPQLLVLFEPVWAFCRGWWSPSSFNLAGADITLFRADRVLQRWAQFERDGDAAGAERDALALADDDEIGPLARLLAARAQTKAGHAASAVGEARAALGALAPMSRIGIEARLWTALAQRVLADALAAAGDRSAAGEHYAAAARLAPQCWFGQPPSRSPAPITPRRKPGR
ncbi:MAG: serine/threonine protein kinase [Acidobacteria bacterium]|nr:MAG: serine/threonine protein kinase [Acidobacteriota bacterium]